MNVNKTIHDLIADPTFISWVQKSGGARDNYWEEWAQASPENAALAEEASAMVRGIPFREQRLPEETVDAKWRTLLNDLPATPPPARKEYVALLNPWHVAAAITFLALTAGLAYWALRPAYVEYQTGNGERLEIALPDGSSLTLNANSHLGFHLPFDRGDAREVDLRGEALLEIKTLPDQRPFRVRTSDLTVEVLGTTFNVHSRRATSVVSLISGRVQLRSSRGDTLTITPGQSAWFDAARNDFTVDTGDAVSRCAWVEQRWVFEEPVPFATVLEQVSDLYGLSWELSDPALLEKELEGDISIESKQVLLNSLSLALDVEIIETGESEIFIKEKD